MKEYRHVVADNPVIAGVRDMGQFSLALKSLVECIFLMTGDIFTIEDCVKEAREYHKRIFIQIDLIKGIASDKEGIQYLAKRIKPDGIISTKGHLIKLAKSEKLLAVQHFFLIDTHAYETSLKSILDTQPDAVGIMPGLIPRVIQDMKTNIKCPIIASGLIRSEQEIRDVLDAGAQAVLIGDEKIWTIDIKPKKTGD